MLSRARARAYRNANLRFVRKFNRESSPITSVTLKRLMHVHIRGFATAIRDDSFQMRRQLLIIY